MPTRAPAAMACMRCPSRRMVTVLSARPKGDRGAAGVGFGGGRRPWALQRWQRRSDNAATWWHRRPRARFALATGQRHFFLSASWRIILNRVGTPSEVVTEGDVRTNRVSVAWASMLAASPARLVKMAGA